MLLEPVVEAALRIPVAQAGPPARLVGDVVLEVAAGRGSPAAGAGAGGVPDLGQVPEHDPGVVASCLVAVITVAGGDRPDLDEQVPLPGDPGGESPGSVSAGRSGLISGGEGEPCSAGRVGPAGRAGFAPCRPVGGCRPGAAVPDGVALAVGDGHAPGGPGVAGRGGGQVAGQVGVDGADAGHLAGPSGEVQQGGRRDGQVDPAGEPGRDHPGQRPGRRRGRGSCEPGPSGPSRSAGPVRRWPTGWPSVPSGPLPSGRESMPSNMSR